MVTIDEVKKLRDQTGLSITKCKEALEECGGNFDKAIESLREKGSLAAEKKASRDLGAGVIGTYIHTTKTDGAIVELLCETDFVAKNEEFVTLANEIALQIVALKPRFVKKEDVPNEVIEQMKSELLEEVKDKPKDMQERILEGKLDSKIRDSILLEQKFIKDETKTVKDVIDSGVQKFGERIEVGRFSSFSI